MYSPWWHVESRPVHFGHTLLFWNGRSVQSLEPTWEDPHTARTANIKFNPDHFLHPPHNRQIQVKRSGRPSVFLCLLVHPFALCLPTLGGPQDPAACLALRALQIECIASFQLIPDGLESASEHMKRALLLSHPGQEEGAPN
jgi:hypothetical protein